MPSCACWLCVLDTTLRTTQFAGKLTQWWTSVKTFSASIWASTCPCSKVTLLIQQLPPHGMLTSGTGSCQSLSHVSLHMVEISLLELLDPRAQTSNASHSSSLVPKTLTLPPQRISRQLWMQKLRLIHTWQDGLMQWCKSRLIGSLPAASPVSDQSSLS